ncbi:MAG: FAA hydrolase family protein, partial [Brevundimonas sp.]
VAALGPDGVVGWAVGCDLTRRDIQAAAKEKGRPWDAAKGFDQSAPCGVLTLGALPDPDAVIRMSVNGVLKQEGRLGDMILDPEAIVAEANKLWTIRAGDLIFTGTPEGVGPLVRGDRVEATIEGLEPLTFTVAP